MTIRIGWGVAVKRAIAAAALALLAAAGPARAEEDMESRSGITFGPRASYFHPKAADSGTWSGGAQLRLHFTPVLAVEGSADYRQSRFEGRTVDVYPVQASLMIYLLPGAAISPYILGGGGWYYTHFRDGDHTDQRFGPHAGAGLEMFLSRNWSIDGSYRYLWAEDIHSQDAAHPLGKNFSDKGYMVTAAINYRF